MDQGLKSKRGPFVLPEVERREYVVGIVFTRSEIEKIDELRAGLGRYQRGELIRMVGLKKIPVPPSILDNRAWIKLGYLQRGLRRLLKDGAMPGLPTTLKKRMESTYDRIRKTRMALISKLSKQKEKRKKTKEDCLNVSVRLNEAEKKLLDELRAETGMNRGEYFFRSVFGVDAPDTFCTDDGFFLEIENLSAELRREVWAMQQTKTRPERALTGPDRIHRLVERIDLTLERIQET